MVRLYKAFRDVGLQELFIGFLPCPSDRSEESFFQNRNRFSSVQESNHFILAGRVIVRKNASSQ